MIKNDLTIRLYFKSNVVVDAIQDSELKLSDVQLILRMKELDEQNKIHLYKQPKINHMFQKKILYKYNIPALVNGQQYKVNLAGMNHISSAVIFYIRDQESNIRLSYLNNTQWSYFRYSIDNYYITDGSGVNIQNNNVSDLSFNDRMNFLFFKRAFNLLVRNFITNDGTNISDNNGRLNVISFGKDQIYDNNYNGGFSFKDGDYYLNFTSRCDSYNRPMVLYALFLVPALLELENGNLEEYYN
jgi:hypothetical protein